MPPTIGTDPLLGITLDARYRIDSRIAHGGMATVYAGHDVRLDRAVAVKVLHPHLAQDANFAARFIAEARQAARINHPNVVAVHDQGLDGEHAFIVMELVRGQSVRALLRSVGKLSAEQALALLTPVATGLAAAHEAGVLHRDIKPENILISDEGRVKLTDFGLARAADDIGPGLTGAGALAGTAAYLSPEYVEGKPSTARSDIYSLGLVGYELLTGEPAFFGENPVQLALAHSRGQVPTPSSKTSGINPEVDALILHATQRNAEQRFPHADALISEIRRVRALLPAPTPLPRPRASMSTADSLDQTRLQARATQLLPATPDKVRRGRKNQHEPKPARPHRFRRRFAGLLFISVVAGGGVWAWQTYAPVDVPSVAGSNQSVAAAALTNAGFTHVRVTREFSTEVPAGEVIRSIPSEGTQLRRAAPVTLVVSRGVQQVPVPNLTRLTASDAARQVAALGLSLATQQNQFNETVPAGSVITTKPQPGTKVNVGSEVTLIVSKGPAPVAVPSVKGLDSGTASATIQAAGLMVSRTDSFNDTVPKGRVISISPTAGELIAKGSTVTLTVSKGPALVTVPNLRLKSEAKAIAALKSLGLKVRVRAPAGRNLDKVVAQSAKAGSRIPRGTTVTLTVV